MNKYYLHEKVLESLCFLAVFYIALFFIIFTPSNVCAESSYQSSSNYQVSGQLDFSGQTSSSQNYQVSGIMTDIKDISVWPEEEISASAEPSPPPQPPAKKTFISPIVDTIKLFLDNPYVQALQNILAIAAAIFALLGALMPWLLNLPWLSLGSSAWSGILSFFGWYRKRKRWGVVYDAESNQPIPLAAVRIFDAKEKKLLETQITNKEGIFGFLVKPGRYYLQVIKENYFYPSKITDRDYHGQIFDIKEESVLNLNIPMDPDIKKLAHRLGIVTQIQNAFQYVRYPVLILGTILAILYFIIYDGWLNGIILFLYIILWSVEIYKLRQTRPYGIVANIDNKTPIYLAIIRVMDKVTNRLIATRVSGPKGYYYYVINPGEYTLVVTKEEYDQYKIADLPIKKGEALARDIYMNKKNK